MKTAFTATTADIDANINTGEVTSAWSPRALIGATVAAIRKSAAERSLRRQLGELDDAILRDIGISDDEIWRVRSGHTFTPRAWM